MNQFHIHRALSRRVIWKLIGWVAIFMPFLIPPAIVFPGDTAWREGAARRKPLPALASRFLFRVESTSEVADACLSQNRRPQLALLRKDGTVEVWNIINQQKQWDFACCPSMLGGISFSSDGKLLAGVSNCRSLRRHFYRESRLRIWSSGSGKLLHEIPIGETRGATAASFAPNGRLIATIGHHTGSNSDSVAKVRIWDLESEGLAFTLNDPSPLRTGGGSIASGFLDVEFSPSGNAVASVSQYCRQRSSSTENVHGKDKGICCARLVIWDIESRSIKFSKNLEFPSCEVPMVRFGDPTPEGPRIAFRPDGNRLAVASHDGTVRLYTYPTMELMRIISTGRPSKEVGLTFAERRLFASDLSSVLVVDECNKDYYVLRDPAFDPVNHYLAVSSEARHLVRGLTNGTIEVFRLAVSEGEESD